MARYVGKNEIGDYLSKYRKKVVKMHRILMNPPEKMTVDHINGNGLDNRKENLRICTVSENKCNSGKTRANSSGYKGVTWHNPTKKWVVRLMVRGEFIRMGSFIDKKEAALAYNKAAKKYHGEFANINKI